MNERYVKVVWDISKQCPTMTIRQQKKRIALKAFSPISDAAGTGNTDCGFTESSIPKYNKINNFYLLGNIQIVSIFND